MMLTRRGAISELLVMAPQMRDTRERLKACLEEWFFFEQYLQKGVDCLSVVFSLNGAVAEPSRGESARQAHLTLTPLRMSSGVVGAFADGWAMARKKTNWMDQSIASH